MPPPAIRISVFCAVIAISVGPPDAHFHSFALPPGGPQRATWPRDILVLQPRRDTSHSFVDTMVAVEAWPSDDVVLGASVRNGLHAVTVGAVANIVAKRTGKLPRGAMLPSDPMADLLGDWLLNVAHDPPRFPVPVKQLSYIFASGAHRARAIARTLAHIEHRPIVRVIDIGTAAGMIPWLAARRSAGNETVRSFRAGTEISRRAGSPVGPSRPTAKLQPLTYFR